MHWLTAGTFIILAISGLNVTFGKTLLLPLIGPEAFTGFSQWAKYAHNYLSFPFTLGLVFILLMWIKDNIPNAVDVRWLKQGGGLVGNSASAGATSSTPARRSCSGSWFSAAARAPSPAIC